MFIQKITTIFALAALATPLAFASSGSTWVGGEAGFETHPPQSGRTRAEAQGELRDFRANPVTSDGGRKVGGELGYVPHQHAYTTRDGQRVHNDPFGQHSAARAVGAAPAISESGRQAMQQQYIN